MPRDASTRALALPPRTTRSSTRSAPPVEPCRGSTKAFRDVSNSQQSGKSEPKETDTVDNQKQPLRRSSRLSREKATQQPQDAERKRSLRRSTLDQTQACVERAASRDPHNSSKATKVDGKKEQQGSKKPPAPKRAREANDNTEQPPLKKARKGRNSARSVGTNPFRGTPAAQTRTAANTVKEGRIVSLSTPRNKCNDFLSSTDHNLVRVRLEEYFDSSKYAPGIASFDKAQKTDVLAVSDYVADIFQRLYNAETNTRPKRYMDLQPHLNSMMRAILVDWIVEVHMKFRLVPDTLYLCVNIIDRYLSRVVVERSKLQLVGVTALLIACKYEEIYAPEVRDCVYITDRAYTRQELLDTELEIIRVLKFKMTVPTGYPFLKRFLSITNAGKTTQIAANYYMERSLQEHAFLEFRPSLVAAAAVCLAINNPGVRLHDNEAGELPGVPPVLLTYTSFRKYEILEVAERLAEVVATETTTGSRRQLIAVKNKYNSSRYQYLSTELQDPDVGDIVD